MKNKLVSFLVFIFSIHYCPAQEITNHDIVSVTKITFLNPGISHEARIAKLQSVYLQAFMNTSAYFFSSSTFGTSAGVYFEPAFTIQYRYYYNATKRESRGKRTALNNLNYISPVFEMMFSDNRLKSSDYPEENARPITRLAFVWGMQRNYSKRFSLDFNLGFGWLFAKGTTLGELGQKIRVHHSQPILAGQLNLGFWLGNKTL
jgi:hypothetical protein